MRPLAWTAALLTLAGCLTPTPPIDGPEGGRPFDDPECPRIAFALAQHVVQTASDAEMAYRVTNCTDETLAYAREGCEGSGLVATVEGQGLRLRILGEHGPAILGEPHAECGEDPSPRPTIAPNETIERTLRFSGSYMTCDGVECDFGLHWAPPGAYLVTVEFRDDEGRIARGGANLTLAPPVLPGFDAEGDVRFVMHEAYRVGERVEVRVHNRGEATYGYSTYYAACGAGFYNETAYPFRIPPGTHCDIANTSPLAPNATVTLFNWSFDICTKDLWGCAQSEPLPPGTYHVRLEFWEWSEAGYATADARRTTAGWDFTLHP